MATKKQAPREVIEQLIKNAFWMPRKATGRKRDWLWGGDFHIVQLKGIPTATLVRGKWPGFKSARAAGGEYDLATVGQDLIDLLHKGGLTKPQSAREPGGKVEYIIWNGRSLSQVS